MGLFAQLTVNGLIAGSIYALVASGFSLIYSTNRIMHFAHGISVVIAAYLAYTLFSLWGLPFLLAGLLTIILTGLVGVAMYRFVYLPMEEKKASMVILLMASIAMLLFFQNLVQAIYGADVKTLGYLKVARGMDLFGAIITPLQLFIIGTSLVLLVGLYWFMKHTKLGRNMRAVADNKELADVVGIDARRVSYYSFFIGSALAGLAGILIGLEQNLDPSMGINLIIKGFTGAVMGGVLSVPASVVGSYVLGFAENYGIWYLPSGYKDAIAFILLFLFLLWRPDGLFGVKRDVR